MVCGTPSRVLLLCSGAELGWVVWVVLGVCNWVEVLIEVASSAPASELPHGFNRIDTGLLVDDESTVMARSMTWSEPELAG